mgnify:FL=1
MTAPVVAHTPIISRTLDIPSPLSVSSIWVRVSVSVRRCCRFSGLYAFHSSDSVAVGIPRRMIAVLVSYKTTTSSTLALLQRVGHWAHHIRSKSTSENDTGGWGQKRSRTSSACSDGTTAGVVSFRSTRSLGARLNATSDYRLHHSRCSKLTKSIDEVIGLQAKKYSRTDDSTFKRYVE